MSAGFYFPSSTQKDRITTNLHICQRFERGEGGGAKKGRFITSQKFKLKVGIFGIKSWSRGSRADESWQLSNDGLFSCWHTDITKDRKGNGMKRRPLQWVRRRCEDWATSLDSLGLDQIIQPFFLVPIQSWFHLVPANAPKAFSNIQPSAHWQEYDWLWIEKHVNVCKNPILFYCHEIPGSRLPGNYKVFAAWSLTTLNPKTLWNKLCVKKYGEKHRRWTHLIGAEGEDAIQILY